MLDGSMAGKRKPGGGFLHRAFHSDVVFYESNQFVWTLLQQGHTLRVRAPTAADDAVQVDAAGHTCAA